MSAISIVTARTSTSLKSTDRETRQVTFGDYDDNEPAWAPDSKRIVFVSNRTENAGPESQYGPVDRRRYRTRSPSLRQLTTAETADASPSWSPDGQLDRVHVNGA